MKNYKLSELLHVGSNLLMLVAFIFFLFVFVAKDVNAQPLTKAQIRRLIKESAIRNGIDPNLAVAIAEVESKLNPNAIGSIGEVGLFQLRPEYHKVHRGNILNNIDIGTRYLAKLQRTCSHYGEAYFVCFNYGPSRKLKYPKLFPYYKRVMKVVVRNERLRNVAAQ